MAKWIFAAIVAIGLLVAFNLQSCGGMVAQFQAGREAQARERLRTQLTANENVGPFFRQFETLFPEEFGAFLEGGRDLERRRAGEREVFEFAQTYMTDFVTTNQHYVVQAEPGELTALGAAVGAMLSALRGEDTRLRRLSADRGDLVPAEREPVAVNATNHDRWRQCHAQRDRLRQTPANSLFRANGSGGCRLVAPFHGAGRRPRHPRGVRG